jgi:sulfide:quinone oxidoreductase
VIVGGGVAALETALALHDFGAEHFEVTLIAPDAEFVYRPMTVQEPFASPSARRYDIAELAQDLDVELRVDRLSWLDAQRRVVHTEAGESLDYDAVVLALGAQARARYEHALTVGEASQELLHGLIQDVEGGYVQRLAFVVPPRMSWPLPIYELALMMAGRTCESNVDLAITVATPEKTPLAVFGEAASSGVSRLLADSGIAVITSAQCEVPDGRHVVTNPSSRALEVDRVIAMPELYGPAVRGLPSDLLRRIPIDIHCAVCGVERVYAAGDATDFALKHGGIAAQQADTAAQSIAALSGLAVEATPFRPEIHGMLLTGGARQYLSAQFIGGRGFSSEITDTPSWSPPTKIAAKFLAPYLDELDRVSGATR